MRSKLEILSDFSSSEQKPGHKTVSLVPEPRPRYKRSLRELLLSLVTVAQLKGTNPALKKPSNIPEIYAKMFGRFH